MAMYLAGVTESVIMLVGCWSKDAFLQYIRRQVAEFTAGVAARMVLPADYRHMAHASSEDPRTSGNQLNHSGRGLPTIGPSIASRIAQPSFALRY